jgi:uncharacterized protein
MNDRVMQKLIQHIFTDLTDGDAITFAFQGGEPTLSGLPFFQKFVDLVDSQTKRVTVHYALQTNGTLINEAWCRFLRKNDFLVGLSIDGNKRFHDMNRVDAKNRGTFQRVMKAKQLFDQYDIKYNVLCVLTNQMAKHTQLVFKYILREHIDYIQFIPCLDGLRTREPSPFALRPEKFAYFYNCLFKLWQVKIDEGLFIHINFFEDVINCFNGVSSTCGIDGLCHNQLVIEADGSVYPCDFYALDQYRLGNIAVDRFKDLLRSNIADRFIHSRTSLSSYCRKCEFVRFCHGGCKRMKNQMYVNQAENYCGYQDFLTHNLQKLLNLSLVHLSKA